MKKLVLPNVPDDAKITCTSIHCPERTGGECTAGKLTESEIGDMLEDLHRNFLIDEVEVDGKLYRYPKETHDEFCR